VGPSVVGTTGRGMMAFCVVMESSPEDHTYRKEHSKARFSCGGCSWFFYAR